jgi:hypothetical protein
LAPRLGFGQRFAVGRRQDFTDAFISTVKPPCSTIAFDSGTSVLPMMNTPLVLCA